METKSTVDLRKAYTITVIIGLSIMASLVIYAIIIELIKEQYSPFGGFAPMPDVIATLRYALLGVAVVEFFVIRVMNRFLLSADVPVRNYPGTGQFGPEAQRLMIAAIVTFALCESVAIYGLVLFLIQGNTTDFYLFMLISLVYFSIFFPKYGAWEAWVKERGRPKGCSSLD